MSLFEKLKNKRSSLQEKKDDGIKKPTKKANKEVFDVTGKSAARDAKKYSSGEYPKIGGGSRIGSKSKGPGAETGAKVNLNPTSGSKSKGTTPVKVNITKPVKQSEISKQAKKFTKKINKKNINRPEGVIGDTYVSTTKKGKIRSAKKVNPTLKKSISQVKADIEFKQGLQKSGASGDVSDKAPQKIRDYVTKKREIRADKLGLKDPFKIDTSKAAKQTAKDFGAPTKSDFKKLNKKPGGYRAPRGDFGKDLTPGEFRVKQMSKSSFPITQPRDVKPPKSFTDFTKKIKTLKTDVAKTASAIPRTVTKKYKPTTTVKQSEVSKKAKDFTAKVNRVRMKVTSKPKTTNVFKRVIAATSGKKGSALNPEISGIDFDVPKKTAPINVTDASDGGGKKPPVKRKTGGIGDNKPRKPRKITKKLVSPGVAKVSAAPKATKKITKMLGGSSNVDFYKSGSKLAKGISKVSPKAGKLALGATKTLAKLGTPGRIAATVGTVAALSPAARKGISGFAKQALTGAGLGGVLGASAAAQKESDKERIKKNLPAQFVKDKDGKEIKTFSKMSLNLSDYSKKTKKLKPRTATSLKGSAEYAGKVKNIPAYGAKYTG